MKRQREVNKNRMGWWEEMYWGEIKVKGYFVWKLVWHAINRSASTYEIILISVDLLGIFLNCWVITLKVLFDNMWKTSGKKIPKRFSFLFFTVIQNSLCKQCVFVRVCVCLCVFFCMCTGKKNGKKKADSLSSQSTPLKPSGHRQM